MKEGRKGYREMERKRRERERGWNRRREGREMGEKRKRKKEKKEGSYLRRNKNRVVIQHYTISKCVSSIFFLNNLSDIITILTIERNGKTC